MKIHYFSLLFVADAPKISHITYHLYRQCVSYLKLLWVNKKLISYIKCLVLHPDPEAWSTDRLCDPRGKRTGWA